MVENSEYHHYEDSISPWRDTAPQQQIAAAQEQQLNSRLARGVNRGFASEYEASWLGIHAACLAFKKIKIRLIVTNLCRLVAWVAGLWLSPVATGVARDRREALFASWAT